MSLPPLFADRVMETSTTTGTGTYTLAGAVIGFQAFSAGIGDGVQCYYCAFDVDANGNPTANGWEVGEGVYTLTGTTLSRATILASSNSGSAVSWAAGTRRIFVTLPATAFPSADFTFAGATLSRATYPTGGNAYGLATGTTDLYTVPTGRRALLFAMCARNTRASGNITWGPELKVSGTYYPLNGINASAVTPGNTSAAQQSTILALLEPGDTLSVVIGTNNGMTILSQLVEFDSSSPLKQGRLLGLSSGDNTLYTCPTGKTATTLPLEPLLFMSAVQFTSEASHTVHANLVPSGNSPSSTNQITAATAVFSLQPNPIGVNACGLNFAAGDFLSINVDVGNAAQVATVMVLER